MTRKDSQPEPRITLNSIGYLCGTLQVPPQILAVAARELGITPHTLNGIAHFSDSQVDAITAHISASARAELERREQADDVPLEPSAQQRQLATREPLDLLDAIEDCDDAEQRADLAVALAVSIGSRCDAEVNEHRDAAIQLLTRVAAGEPGATEELREWIVRHLITAEAER